MIKVEGLPDPVVHEACIPKRRRENWTRGVVFLREASLSSNSIPPKKVFIFISNF
jgi:hypothetical protein